MLIDLIMLGEAGHLLNRARLFQKREREALLYGIKPMSKSEQILASIASVGIKPWHGRLASLIQAKLLDLVASKHVYWILTGLINKHSKMREYLGGARCQTS